MKIIYILLIFTNISYCQSTMNADADKYAHRQTKRFSREGWQTQPGPEMFEMFKQEYLLRNEIFVSAEGTFSRYICATGNAKANTLNAAQRQAETISKENLLTAMQSSISGTISTQISNAQLSIDVTKTVAEIKDRFEHNTSGDLVNIRNVISVYRLEKNVYEYSVTSFYDIQQAGRQQLVEYIKRTYQDNPAFVTEEIRKLEYTQNTEKK